MSEGYNGWTNYETWNVKLWMDNDEGEYNYWREQAQEAYDNAKADDTFTREERAALDLMDTLKNHHEEVVQDMLEACGRACSWIADLLNSSVNSVNWHEIAVSLLENVDKEEEVSAE